NSSFGFFQRWHCVSAKTKCAVCAVGFLYVAQLVICGISFPFLIVIFRIRGTFVPPYRFAYTLKQPRPMGSLSPSDPFGPHACKSSWSLACCAPKAPVCALSLCPVPIIASHCYALKCSG